MARRSLRGDAGRRTDAEELALYREFVRQLTATCDAASRGDLEARSRLAPAARAVPELAGLNDALNRVLDVSDAFVRESSAALSSAAEGRFPRSCSPPACSAPSGAAPPTSTAPGRRSRRPTGE